MNEIITNRFYFKLPFTTNVAKPATIEDFERKAIKRTFPFILKVEAIERNLRDLFDY